MPTYTSFPTTVPGPSYPIEKQAEPRIKRVEFGDGYTQESPDGINFNQYVWSLNWETLTLEEKTIIENFLVARAGYQTFQWTDPENSVYKVKCKSWNISEFAPKIYSIKATFNQVPI